MSQAFKILGKAPEPTPSEAEIRVPTAGTWLGLGAGILVVVAGFVWTII